jgi:hypothetical protein
VSRAALAILLAVVAAGTAARAEELPVRDPMRPFAVSLEGSSGGAAAAPRFELTAVLLAADRRVAVVNGRPYLLGELVDGARIVAIEAGAVRFDDNGSELVIPLGRKSAPPIAEGETAP